MSRLELALRISRLLILVAEALQLHQIPRAIWS